MKAYEHFCIVYLRFVIDMRSDCIDLSRKYRDICTCICQSKKTFSSIRYEFFNKIGNQFFHKTSKTRFTGFTGFTGYTCSLSPFTEEDVRQILAIECNCFLPSKHKSMPAYCTFIIDPRFVYEFEWWCAPLIASRTLYTNTRVTSRVSFQLSLVECKHIHTITIKWSAHVYTQTKPAHIRWIFIPTSPPPSTHVYDMFHTSNGRLYIFICDV